MKTISPNKCNIQEFLCGEYPLLHYTVVLCVTELDNSKWEENTKLQGVITRVNISGQVLWLILLVEACLIDIVKLETSIK